MSENTGIRIKIEHPDVGLDVISCGRWKKNPHYAFTIMNGRQKTITGMLCDIAAVFGCSVDYLLGFDVSVT